VDRGARGVVRQVGAVAVLPVGEAPVVGGVALPDRLDALVELLGDVLEHLVHVVVVADAGGEGLAGDDEGAQPQVGGGRPAVVGGGHRAMYWMRAVPPVDPPMAAPTTIHQRRSRADTRVSMESTRPSRRARSRCSALSAVI